MEFTNTHEHPAGFRYQMSSPRKSSWRVVIATDETQPAEFLGRTVTRLGHTVVGSAQTGREALELARQVVPDILIMDWRMAQADGWTALAELLREMPTPIVMIGALNDPQALEAAAAAGASAYLAEPVLEDDLNRALELAVVRFADLHEIRRWRGLAERRAQELEQLVGELSWAHESLVGVARRATAASLALGLAHEINNALTPIIGNAQMIALLNEREPETVERANQIVDHAKRIAGWTGSLRQVQSSREQILPFSLNGLIQDVAGLYAERFQRLDIRCHLELELELPVIEGNPDQVRQVLMNLIQNSIEAMRGGGELAIATVHNSAENEAQVVIRDTGVGIASEDLAHVFEPGFTTKRQSAQDEAGFGWGLFTCRELAEGHGGRIEIHSPAPQLDRGTQVNVYLPINP